MQFYFVLEKRCKVYYKFNNLDKWNGLNVVIF